MKQRGFIFISIIANIILTFTLVSPFSLVSNLGGYLLGTGSNLLSTPLILLMYIGEVALITIFVYVYLRWHDPANAIMRIRNFVIIFVVIGFFLVIPIFLFSMFIPIWPSS
ncbi:MAG: hypothetical protein Q8L47_00985 [bacterium]|nr:hypothetical protein [bacterium]